MFPTQLTNLKCLRHPPAGGTALPTNVEHDRLMGLLAAGLLSGATTAWALKVGKVEVGQACLQYLVLRVS